MSLSNEPISEQNKKQTKKKQNKTNAVCKLWKVK